MTKWPMGGYDQRRIWAKKAWIYLSLLFLASLMLGVFVVAFTASLKNDALSDPLDFELAQLQPKNWLAAGSLGLQGGDGLLMGGFAPGARLRFQVTYALPGDQEFTEPDIRIPRRKPGSGMAAVAYPHYAADYAKVTGVRRIGEDKGVHYVQRLGTKRIPRQGKSVTWEFYIDYLGEGPRVTHLPLDITTPREQVLIDSSLPPSRFERRDRVASWVNVSPGVIGYVFRNYVRVWKETVSLETGESLFLKWTVNSFLIAIGKTLLTLILACTAGYALARTHFVGNRLVFLLMVFSMTLPMQVTFISNYEIFNYLGLLNTPWAVIAMVIASAQVLIMKQFFENFPKELEEAAVVDGASHFTILWRIFIPLAKPAMASVAIMGFQGAWNDFFWPLVVLTTPPDAYTLPVGLLSLRNSYGVAGDWSLILAGSFLSTLPVLIIFILFQRYFVGNNLSSAVKG